MSVQYLNTYSRKRGKTIPSGWWYVYTAYAPFDDGRTLVKVGISSIPHERMVSIYCTCPFTIRLAAWAPAGRKKLAMKIERKILKEFERYKTRGEWLLLPNDKDSKKMFAQECRKAVEEVTRRSVKWDRFTESQIRAVIAVNLRSIPSEWD